MLLTPSNDKTLDYIHIKESMKMANGTYIYGEEATRASKLVQKLKNVVMQVITKNREQRKVPKLKDILNDAIKRKQKEDIVKR